MTDAVANVHHSDGSNPSELALSSVFPGRLLPAGDYSITMESSAAPALIRSASGETKMFTGLPIHAESEKGKPCLFITLRGNEHQVLSMNVLRLGASLIYESLANTEREQRAKAGQIQTVPVIIAAVDFQTQLRAIDRGRTDCGDPAQIRRQ